MCYHTRQNKSIQAVEKRFRAKVERPEFFNEHAVYNGFSFPITPVILNSSPAVIREIGWGLIPAWSKNESIRAYTLNAKIETISDKPSFRDVQDNRCLVIADGFYEWQWLDSSGKQKQKYLIRLPDDEVFSLAGLYSEWVDKTTGEIKTTYTILTTEANKLMSEIHNHKKRMPVILSAESEEHWLRGVSMKEFKNISPTLSAEKV